MDFSGMHMQKQERNPFSIAGKRALVTGGSMGIGMGIVKRFLDAGARVLIADKETRPAEAYMKSLPKEVKERLSILEVDLLDEEAPTKMISWMIEEYGGIDILVNNAGIYPAVPMLEMKPELFDTVYRINLRALAFTSRAAAKRMIEDKVPGKIINIASIDSVHPSQIGLAAYDASKGGVLMFTKNFALELANYGITVNAIAPGVISTEGTGPSSPNIPEEQLEKMLEEVRKKIPLKRMGVPDDIAKVTLFMASSGSAYMTGSLVIVDGGILLK